MEIEKEKYEEEKKGDNEIEVVWDFKRQGQQ